LKKAQLQKVEMNKNLSKIISKKGRSLTLLPFFIFIVSCASDPSRYGRVSPHNTGDQNSFTFTVSDEFLEDNYKSPPDKENPKLNKAEAKLLYSLLKEKKYCLVEGTPQFNITSRQEKIYDMTFAHLIEQNYRSRPIVPRTYFGNCKAK